MNKEKKFLSLNVQLSLAVVMGILIAAVVYICCTGIGQYLINVNFLSDKAVEKNVGKMYASLQNYISEENVEGTDNEQLSHWLKKNDYTYLYIYDNYGATFEAGWSDEPHADISSEGIREKNEPIDGVPRIDRKNFDEDAKNRIIDFADQEYYVFIDVYREQVWYGILDIVTIIACFITLLASLLVYNATVLRRIKHFSEEVETVADGNLDAEIHNLHNDEIGKLAASVDNMRYSIIQKHESEKMAWKANQELITAMSHDIRSPLTSIIGYLDIINDKKDGNREELDKYVDACRMKAFQLKELSDKLFQYFLVFGNAEKSPEFETVDASLLFQQILGEHSAELMSYGYKLTMDMMLEECSISVDISGIRRLFDNVFQNIKKYADIERPVSLSIQEKNDFAVIKIMNYIPEVRKKVESTNIGIKTCIKICEAMGGNFTCKEDKQSFSVTITLPLKK